MDRPDRPRAYQAPASTNAAKKTGFVNSTKIVQAPFGYAAQAAAAAVAVIASVFMPLASFAGKSGHTLGNLKNAPAPAEPYS